MRPKNVRERWETLEPGNCFFVPALDTLEAEKICRLEGYYPRKNAPVTARGIYRGMTGVLCWREASRGPVRRKKQI